MNEKFRSRIITSGDVSPDKKESIRRRHTDGPMYFESLDPSIAEAVDAHGLEILPEEIALIRFAEDVTNEAMRKAGVKPFEIPLNHYHVLPAEVYEKHFSGNATTYRYKWSESIFMNADSVNRKVLFGSITLHELMHVKSHRTLHVIATDTGLEINHRRDGVSVISNKAEEGEFFRGLHEAIVATQEKISFPDMLSIPEMKDDKNFWESSEAATYRQEMSEYTGVPADDFLWVQPVGDTGIEWRQFSYHHHREVLKFICEKIQETYSEYADWVGVYEEFRNAHFNGDLLKIARLVEDRFGKGSFRILGEMTNDDESAIQCLEKMKVLSGINVR